ncbi:MAG: hypothetical protein O8C67_07070 [Candidatus Methanoperedens sp.]|nr:hypothetical protein [Candidatus Methanoperedens sp.]
MEIGPKVVHWHGVAGTQDVYWCVKRQQQIAEKVCKLKCFRQSSSQCRLCCGLPKGHHWPEPWASLGLKASKDGVSDRNHPRVIHNQVEKLPEDGKHPDTTGNVMSVPCGEIYRVKMNAIKANDSPQLSLF